MLIPYEILAISGILISGGGVQGLLDQILYRFNADARTYFNVFTPDSIDTPKIVLSIENASSIALLDNFDGSLPMRLIVHGWYKTPRAEELCDRYFTCGKFNVVIVDWTQGTDTIVVQVVELNVPVAAKAIASFLQILSNKVALNVGNIQIVGEGLGAHVAGEIGNRIGNLSTIVGFDPDWSLIARRISRDDAQYVQILHSSWTVGRWSSLGDADFFINSGFMQPGCEFLDFECDHRFATGLYIKSICQTPYFGCRQDFNGDCGYAMGGEPVYIYQGDFDVQVL